MVAEILLHFGQCKGCTISLSIDLQSISAEFCSIAYSEAPSCIIKTMKSLLDFLFSASAMNYKMLGWPLGDFFGVGHAVLPQAGTYCSLVNGDHRQSFTRSA